MDDTNRKIFRFKSWRFESTLLVILYIFLLVIQTKCQTILNDDRRATKIENLDLKVENSHCHICQSSSIEQNDIENNKSKDETEDTKPNNFADDVITTLGTFTRNYLLVNRTETELKSEIEELLDNAMGKDRYEIFDGIEIKSIDTHNKSNVETDSNSNKKHLSDEKGRALFPKYSYEYRLFQKVKTFVDTHILSINLPKAARLVGFRSFGLKKFFLPLLIGAQVFKSIIFAMFLPSILGSFGKILGKGISQLSATSSQASYPPANYDEQGGYSNDNKDFMGYETSPTGNYAFPQDGGLYVNMEEANEVNDNLANVDMSRFGPGGQKVSYLPVKNSYYKNQVATASNNYKVFQKIPASSMILSNYDPFYSPLLSRLDGIFARLGLAPSENLIDESAQIAGQSLSDVKLESCREQLICLMYSSPTKYAPYSNLVSAQLSRELNELRRPVSDNPEILRFFRYMRAARRGQEGADCMRTFPACTSNAAPAHTMFAAYHDINKLVSARKLPNSQ